MVDTIRTIRNRFRPKKKIEDIPINDPPSAAESVGEFESFGSMLEKSKTIASETDSSESTATLYPPFESIVALSIIFQSVEQVFNKIDQLHSRDFMDLHVHNVTPDIVKTLSDEREKRGRNWRLNHYIPDYQLLIITVPSLPHETMCLEIQGRVHLRAGYMGLDDEWQSTGATEYPGYVETFGHTGAGEGDGGGKPLTHRPKRTDYPTLVIEAAYSQSLTSLREKMRWWFRVSEHNVNIVLLAHTNYIPRGSQTLQSRRKILIEKWIETEQSPSRSGATATRAVSQQLRQLAPERVHENVVTFVGPDQEQLSLTDMQPEFFSVTSGDMILEFRLLFLQEPEGQQHDIVLDEVFWRRYGRRVFQAFL